MIQINLLPEEYKAKSQKMVTDIDYVWKLVPAVIAVFVLAHLAAGVIQASRQVTAANLAKRLSSLEPQRNQLEIIKTAEADPDKKIVDELLAKRVLWSLKLNKMSQHLPPGVWFNEVSIGSKDLVIRGAVFSLDGNQIDAVNRFMSGLRSDKQFMKDFNTLELGPLGTKTIGSYELIDYIITITRRAS